jgi:hypothetical protein
MNQNEILSAIQGSWVSEDKEATLLINGNDVTATAGGNIINNKLYLEYDSIPKIWKIAIPHIGWHLAYIKDSRPDSFVVYNWIGGADKAPTLDRNNELTIDGFHVFRFKRDN